MPASIGESSEIPNRENLSTRLRPALHRAVIFSPWTLASVRLSRPPSAAWLALRATSRGYPDLSPPHCSPRDHRGGRLGRPRRQEAADRAAPDPISGIARGPKRRRARSSITMTWPPRDQRSIADGDCPLAGVHG